MQKKEKPRIQLRFRIALAAGLSGLGGAGMVLLGPAAAALLGVLLLLAIVALAWAAVFSTREEPSERLLRLIKALRRR